MDERQPLNEPDHHQVAVAALAEIARGRRRRALEIADQRLIDQLVQRRRRGVDNDRLDIRDLDPLLTARIENELRDLAPRRLPVGAEQFGQRRARVGRDRKPRRRGLGVDQLHERLGFVRVAFDRGGVRRLFEGAPKRRALLQLPGLDDDRAIARRPREQRLQRRHEVASLRVDPDRAGPPEHRDRIGFVGENAGIARDRVAFEPHHSQRIHVAVERLAHNRLRTLMGQPFVSPVDQIKPDVLRQPLDEPVRRRTVDDGHARAPEFSRKTRRRLRTRPPCGGGPGWGVARKEIAAPPGAHESRGGPRRTKPSRPAWRDPTPGPPPQGGRRIIARPRISLSPHTEIV